MHIYEGVLIACYLLQYVWVNGVTPFRASLDNNTIDILTTCSIYHMCMRTLQTRIKFNMAAVYRKS